VKRIRDRASDLKNFDLEAARYLNLGLASWLLISAFLWRHTETQFLLTILVGAVVATIAPFEVGSPRVRTLNAAAGLVLVLSACALPHTTALTLWNNALIGLAMIGVSFFGPPHGVMHERPPATHDEYDSMGMFESGAPPSRQL
jgi:hypothetical protein